MLYVWFVEWYRKDASQVVPHQGLFTHNQDSSAMLFDEAVKIAQYKIDTEFALRYGSGVYEISSIRCYPADGNLYYL